MSKTQLKTILRLNWKHFCKFEPILTEYYGKLCIKKSEELFEIQHDEFGQN